MDPAAFLHGFLLAFSLIMPLGAQNVFVFSQGASQPRFRQALPVIISAGICDTFLILMAVLGVSLLLLAIGWVKLLLICAGILFLLVIGWNTWHAPVDEAAAGPQEPDSLKRKILFTLSVSLLNPHAILDTVGVIGTASLSYSGPAKVSFTAACILVSWLWFTLLASAGRFLGTVFPLRQVKAVLNRVSAIIIWLCAIYLAVNFFRAPF